MHKLEFTLKQHTPIIHFQYDQDGATLRATEVKPKLDKFIIEKEGGTKECRKNHPEWFISEKQIALDYKMRVLPIQPNKYPIEKGNRNMPMFFGNMGDEYKVNIKGTSIFNSDIILEIISTNDNLTRVLKANFPLFLSATNFGTRQSKGYGCFWLNNTDYANFFPKYYFTICRNINWTEVLSDIELFYKSIRSGIQVVNKEGLTTYYFKSLLFHYFNSKGLKWDKRLIKEGLLWEFIAPQKAKWNGKQESFDAITPYKSEKYLVRDMLGLAKSQDWKSYKSLRVEKEFIKTNQTDTKEITRFKSPIYFKPFYDSEEKIWRIYFGYNEIPDEFHNAAFNVTGNKRSTRLTTPPESVFTMKKYFDFLFKEDNYEGYQIDIESAQYRDAPLTTFLREIFNEIRTNLENND